MGSNLLESSDTFSQLAHDTSSLAAFNTVPGNSYMMVTPLLARDHNAGKNKSGRVPAYHDRAAPSIFTNDSPKTHLTSSWMTGTANQGKAKPVQWICQE